MKIIKSLYAVRGGARVSHAAMFYRAVCDLHRSIGREPRTPERIARDHNENQGDK